MKGEHEKPSAALENPPKAAASDKLWGGRFREQAAASLEAFSASIQYDSRLYRHDIMGSKAHARMLARQGIITNEEAGAITSGLESIQAGIEAGTFLFRPELEDIHMNIEKALTERIGEAGARLHTARSRNDQVNLDMRLYLRDECAALDRLLDDLRRVFVTLARHYLGAIMPGYTHLQRAQPVLLSHHLLAYVCMFGRDQERIKDCAKRINVLPLGAAALAGTGLPIDREMVARELGFAAVSDNSMDTTADRDFVLETLFCLSLTQIHLSRLAEELVLWSTKEFGFAHIGDRYCTGSSLMPQKKNPDIPELVRGKSGRVTGALMSLLMTMKGLPLTYNRDMQEDKEALFDALDTVKNSLAIMAETLQHTSFDRARMLAATQGGCMTATDLADYLVRKDLPFRQAHSVAGRIVARCQEKNCEPAELPLAELQTFSSLIKDDVYAAISIEGSVNSRTSLGGTAQSRVEEALNKLEHQLGIQA